MVDMKTKLHEMDGFIQRMKEKIILRSEKHKDSKTPLHISNLMPHFIDEILELCDITNPDDRKVIYEILIRSWGSMKRDELEDVANMCWIMDVALQNDGWIRPEPDNSNDGKVK